ncbi:hypothetical protein P7K49_003811, partial [Saguinus oedipus]
FPMFWKGADLAPRRHIKTDAFNRTQKLYLPDGCVCYGETLDVALLRKLGVQEATQLFRCLD